MSGNESKSPAHIAVILDGNGRWAQSRGLSRSEGHRAGADALDRMLDHFLSKEISVVSLYAFSTENWKRPTEEVSAIWRLLVEFLDRRVDFCKSRGIRIQSSGDISALPLLSRTVLSRSEKATAGGSNMVANFCLNYGSRREILQATQALIQERLEMFQKTGNLKEALVEPTEEEFEAKLYTSPLPPVDLLIRPGGEKRISNFLLWQSAYAEIYFTDTLWPDFTNDHLDGALAWFATRQRRYGGLNQESQNG